MYEDEGYGDCECGEAEWLEEQELFGVNSCDALRILDGVI